MKTKLYTILFLVILSVTVNAQELPQVVPSSPEAAQFVKYIESPTGITTGVPNIDVNLFNIQELDIEIPVKLNYHAGGIKVEEISSNVGLGWTLNVEALITRLVKDKPDDSVLGIINNPIQNYSGSYIYDRVVNDEIDSEPDVFIFNFLNYSGKFFYDRTNNTFFQQPLSDLKIEPFFTGNVITSFKITTDKGIVFHFGQNENKTKVAHEYFSSGETYKLNSDGVSLEQSNNLSYINSWYLMEIIHNNNNKIIYEYNVNELPIQQLIRVNEFITFSATGTLNNGENLIDSRPTQIFQNNFNNTILLKKIIFNNGYLEVDYDTNFREDLKYGKKINTVKLVTNVKTLAYELEHSYFDSAPELSQFINSFGNHYTKRLRLDKLVKKSYINNSIEENEIFLFEYNEINLPNRFSNSQDYWGYFNSENNSSLIPEYSIGVDFINPISGPANRSVNPNVSMAGSLKKIIYPTGGSKEFVFESNLVSAIFFKGENLYNNLRDKLETHNLFFNKSPSNFYSTLFSEGYKKNFYLDELTVGRVRINKFVENCNQNSSIGFDCEILIKIKGLDAYNNHINQTLSNDFIQVWLPKGNYEIIATSLNSSSDDLPYFEVNLNWDIDPTPDEIYVGGLRLKEIKLDFKNGNPLIKKYFYKSDNFNNQSNDFSSSGFAPSAPVILSDHVFNDELYYKINSKCQIPMININNSFTHYTKVTEIASDAIKTEFYFDSCPDLYQPMTYYSGIACQIQNFGNGNVNSIPLSDEFSNMVEPLYADNRRGNLIKRKDYALKDTTFELVSEEEFTYEEIKTNVISEFGLKYDIGSSSYNCIPLRFGFYSQKTCKSNLVSSTKKKYLNEVVVFSTLNEFNNVNHNQLTSQTISTSTGDTIKTIFSYALEIGNQAMIDKNMVGIPLKTETFKNGEKLSTQETIYKDWGNNLLAPEIIKTAKGSQPLEERIKYSILDNTNGNPLEIEQIGGIKVCYIWGYNKTQPVAKLENIAYSAIPSSHIQAIENATNEANLIMAFNALRNDTTLSNAMITTYTYKPLVGISSVTDPKGDKQTYHYDGFGRLQYVKDAQGNILSENQYHYKTQN